MGAGIGFSSSAFFSPPLRLSTLSPVPLFSKKKQHTWDTTRYAEAAAAAGTPPDTAWIAATDAAAAEALASANAALAAAQAGIDRAGIRAAHGALADLALRRGDAAGAGRAAGRARDYCGSPAQVAETALSAAVAAAAAGAWSTVAAHATKAEAAAGSSAAGGGGGGGARGGAEPPPPLPPVPPTLLAAAAAASAAAAFDARKYRSAALKFAGVGPELGSAVAAAPALGWLGSPADVALLGGLSGAAGLEWGELSTVLLASPAFRDHLDARPDVRAMLDALASGRWGAALRALRARTPDRPAARLDARLAAHGPGLLAAARARILAQYAQPYASLRLEPAAADLGMDVEYVLDFFFLIFFLFCFFQPLTLSHKPPFLPVKKTKPKTTAPWKTSLRP
jgi:hypothetical protein